MSARQSSLVFFSMVPAEHSNFFSMAPAEQSVFFSGTSGAVWFFFSMALVEQSNLFSTAPAEQCNFCGASRAVQFFQWHQQSSLIFFQQCQQSMLQRCPPIFFSGTGEAVWVFQWHQLSSPIFQVAPWRYVLFSLRQQNHSRCLTYQIWSGSNQIWKGGITHGSYEMVHCNALISNTMQQKYKCICLVLEKYTITWNSFVSGWKRFYDQTLKCII